MRMWKLLPLLVLVPMQSGCLMAARYAAKAHHKGQTAGHIRDAFPVGTPMGTVRTAMAERGYRCIDGAGSVALQCDPNARTKGLLKGNWRILFTARDGRFADLRAVKSPKPPKPKTA